MNSEADLAGIFEADRARLVSIATRVLGTRADAEDVVQEAWVRFARQEPGSIDKPTAWLTTVVGRLSIDVLRARTTRAEVPYELDLADLEVTADDSDPEDHAVQADELSLALLVVLGSLGPDERLAFVLHDLFGMPFAEIGPVVGKTADAAKMSASRARRKVRAASTSARPSSSLGEQRAVVDAFLTAAREGDFDALLQILDPDLTWRIHTSHGVTTHVGAEEVLGVLRRGDPSRIAARRVLVNGGPGVAVWNHNGRLLGLMICTVEDGRMTRIDSVLDRKILDAVDLAPPR